MEQGNLFAVEHIPLYRYRAIVAYTIVDSFEADALLEFSWSLHAYGYGYAYRQIGGRRTRHQNIWMHREIMGLSREYDGWQVDHKNRNGLDNRRENLRVVTNGQNGQNTASRPGSTSKYRGVYWHTSSQRWIAEIKMHGKKHYVGCFVSEEDANRAVIAARLQIMPFTIETNLAS